MVIFIMINLLIFIKHDFNQYYIFVFILYISFHHLMIIMNHIIIYLCIYLYFHYNKIMNLNLINFYV